MRVDLGCGNTKPLGWIGVDAMLLSGVDIVHDLEIYPWPFDDNSLEELRASHIVEHINPWKYGFIRWMNEAWRVLQHDGNFTILTPDPWSDDYIGDPTHCNPCSERTWSYFDPAHYQVGNGLYKIYQPRPWHVLSCVKTGNEWKIILRKKSENV